LLREAQAATLHSAHEQGKPETKRPLPSEQMEAAFELVPETGIEPVRLAARDFHTTSAFAASAQAVRGLEHAFTIASRP